MREEGVDPAGPTSARVLLGEHGPVVGVVAAGGVAGALARYGAGLLWPTATGTFPVTTFAINVLGSALIGVVTVLLSDVRPAPPLLRPFVVTGVLGGFTTFSTASIDTERLFQDGRPLLALGYATSTLVAGLVAVTVATLVTRRAFRYVRRETR